MQNLHAATPSTSLFLYSPRIPIECQNFILNDISYNLIRDRNMECGIIYSSQ